MISAITGELRRVEEDRISLQCGSILYELLVPAADVSELHINLGEQVTFHTIFYLEGDAARGNLEPKLIGFLRADDRKFFERFTTVKGIGPKTALKALTVPVGQIAQAIESKDTRLLLQLKGIGRRTAELIVAELSGKMKDFASGVSPAFTTEIKREAFEEDAIAALVALGESKVIAQRLLDRARQSNPQLKTPDMLVREMLRMR
ncbi:MAG TPA: Holliday junction branch migration protein RuvA [Tepidisphaeraceae bacterium]|jgi:Holliday junction DNA helicase RuvA|nr:Holliday junction branch migration protein RuvA [Tepidisphaeraceae bacterium]